MSSSVNRRQSRCCALWSPTERPAPTLTATIALLEKLKLEQTGMPVVRAELTAFRPAGHLLVRLGRPVLRAKATQPEVPQPTLHARHAKQEHFRATMEVPPQRAAHVQQTHSPLKARMLARLGRPAMLENFARLETQPPMLPVRLAPLPSTNQTRPVRRQAAFPVQLLMSTAQEVRQLARAHWPLVTRAIALWTA